MNNTSSHENLNQEKNKNQSRPNNFDEERYGALKHKYLLQSLTKISPQEEKKMLEEYNSLFSDKFGTSFKMTPEEKEEYFHLRSQYETMQNQNGIENIKAIHAELIRSPLPEKFSGFPKQDPNKDLDEFMLSEEQIRVFMSSLPSEILAIFNQYFSISFYKNEDKDQLKKIVRESSGGAVVEKYQDQNLSDKFRIYIDIESFYKSKEKEENGFAYTEYIFQKSRFLYTITRAILSTIKDKSEFIEFAEKSEKLSGKKIDKNCSSEFDDWLAYLLVNPQKAKVTHPELYSAAKSWLKNGFQKENFVDTSITPEKTIIEKADFDSKLEQGKKRWKNSLTGAPIESKGWLSFLNFTDSLGLGSIGSKVFGIAEYFSEIKLAFEEGYLYAQNESAENEVKRLLGQELSGGDYHKLMKKPQYYNNEDKMKALIFVLAKKGAYHWQFGQLWLYRWDETFQKTKGQEVSMKGFNFINKVNGIIATQNRILKTVEYKQVGTRFVHNSYQDQIARFDNIFETMSLRDLQRAAADPFNNLYCPETQKFIGIDAKLGETHMQGKGKFYIQNDISLDDMLPPGEAEKFVDTMQSFSKESHDEDFNRLVDPIVVSMIKKYVQESRQEPNLFNIYTSSMVKKAFDYYKDHVGETQASQKQLDDDYQNLSDALENNDYNPEVAIENKSYDEINLIYKENYKEENEAPYTRGKEKTKFGRFKELIHQSFSKLKTFIANISLPESLRDFIISELLKFEDNKNVSVEEINAFNSEVDKKLSDITPDVATKARKYIDEYLKDLERYTVIRAYQNVFRPYVYEINKFKDTKKSKNKIDIGRLNKWYLTKLLPEKSSIEQKLRDIEFASNQTIIFSENEKNYLLSLAPDVAINKLTDIMSSKLERSTLDSGFNAHYHKLNEVYFNINQSLLYPERFSSELPKFIEDFNHLNLIPQSIKDKTPKSIPAILKKLQIAKAVADDYYQEEELRRQYRNGRSMLDLYQEEEEYENALQEEAE